MYIIFEYLLGDWTKADMILSLLTARAVKKEIKLSGDSEILNEIVRDFRRKSENHEVTRVVSRTIS